MRFDFWSKTKKSGRGEVLEVDEIFFDQHQLNYHGDLKWEDRIEKNISGRNLAVFRYVLLICVAIAASRGFYLAVLNGREYSAQAAANYIKEIWDRSPRGIIYDARLKPLVNNVSSFNLIVIPGELPRDKETQLNIINILAQLLKRDPEEITREFSGINRFSFKPVLVLEDLTHDEIIGLKSKLQDLPGLRLEENFKRDYGLGIFNHVLGYTGHVTQVDVAANPDYLLTDIVGKTGLEFQYEKYLRGRHGVTLVETRAQGGTGQVVGQAPSEAGDNLVLFLDADLQKKLTEVMSQALADHNLTSGAAVALDPASGGILALQSFPLFDGNIFSSRLDAEVYNRVFENKNRPLFNRAVSGLYPPGSTIKPFLGVAALQEKVVDDKTIVNDTGVILAGNQEFHGWKPLGLMDIYKAIAYSSNIFFYTVGGGYGEIAGLGPVKIKSYLEKFGFTSPTQVDLPGEAVGFIPSPDWKRMTRREGWFIGDTYNMSIGQGFVQVTPLELAVATAAIANKGALVKPRIVKSITDKSGNAIKTIEPEIISQGFVEPQAMGIIREAMRGTVVYGSGQALAKIEGGAAGKTGTAQTGVGEYTHAWFTVFAPYENPKIVLTILAENIPGVTSIAVPIARDVLEWYLNRN